MPKAAQRPRSYTELAEVAYNAYSKSAKGRNVRGQVIPTWDEQTEAVKQHWIAAMIAVVEHSGAL